MPFLLDLLLLSLVVYDVWSNNCALGHVARPMSSSEDYINFRLEQILNNKGYAAVANDEIWMDETAASAGKWKNLWSRSSHHQQQQPLAVNLFDETFIIDERRQVLSVTLNLDEANNTREEHQLNLASPNQPIKFIKTYFRSPLLSLIIVCQPSYCTHYQAVNISSFQHEQSIEYPGLFPIDAAFFSHADKPHLVIAYDSDDYYYANGAVPSSKIYQWNGTRMISVDDIVISSPKSVVTFENGRSTVIMFTVEQNADATLDNSACVIYQLNDRNEVRRLSHANVDDVVSIHPYNYANRQFFLTLDAMGSAEISRWNGAGFETLANLPDIQPTADQIRIVQIDDETLLFFSYLDALCVYKIKDEEATHLADLALVNGQRVIEITAWKYKDAIMLLLVKMNADGTFQTELWQLHLRVEQTDAIVDSWAKVWACLRELKGALDSRGAAINHYQMAQSNESGKTLHIGDLKMNGGNISSVKFRKQHNATLIASPRQMKEKLIKLEQNVSTLKDNMLKMGARLSGNVSVESEVRIEELRIDSLKANYINGKRADLENYLISGIDQQFSTALNVQKVSIDELSVSSLCGYGFDHWMQVNDSARSSIVNLKNTNGSSIIVDDDTIVIESDLIMKELNARRINGIDWKDFLENVFVIGKEQTIRGTVRYEGIVQVARLYSGKVNNVSSSDLITRPSNQSLEDVFIDKLEVDELYVEKINGVPIDGAARMSRENVIKGKLTLAKLVITDELIVNENIAIPLTHPTQVYDQIYIDGHVFVKNLEFEKQTALNISGEPLRANLRRGLMADSWTKSTDQLIEAPITLRRGASIDRLDCRYLNDLAEHDFLYTDSSQLDDLENVTFANFHFNGVVGQSGGELAGFVEETNDRLTFRRAVRMRHLAVRDTLLADKYNGIPIESIMRPSDLPQLPDDFEFETVRVDAEMRVDELRVDRLNSKSIAEFGAALRTDHNASLPNRLSLDKLHLTSLNVSVGKLNGRDLERALASLEELSSANSSIEVVTIEARVTIEGDLQVDRINDEEARDYISRMRDADPSSLMEIKSLVNLTVVENFEVNLLNGQKLDYDFFAGALSRAERQTLGERVTFIDAQMNYLTADAINGLDLSKLIYVDGPLVIYGNVSFSRLHVDGHVTSQTFNGQNVSKLERRLRRLPINSMVNLLVQADVKWEEASSDLRSLTHLLDNAVTKHERQLVASPITFEKPVVVESLYLSNGGSSEISRKISEIISDTVVDSGDSITIRGTKIFKLGLMASNLQVDGNIDIEYVNGLDIRRIALQLVQKDKAELVSADITFLDTVEIGRLLTKNNVHGVALQQLAVVGQKMPKNLHFHDLHVDGNVSLQKLDGIDFDDFIKRRVTVNKDEEIFVDAQFMHSVRVLNDTVVASVNQVVPENLIKISTDGIPIMVHGNKIFSSKLTVEQNVEAPLINDFLVDSIYENAVLNGANANILGSLIFEGKVEMSGNLSVSEEINGFEHPSETIDLANRLVKNTLSKETFLLKTSPAEIEKESFAASVFYLEEERKLNWHLAGVQSIKSLTVKNKTRLEIVTAEEPKLCALRSDCLCRKQYVIDILPSGVYEIQEENANNVSNSFYLPEGSYGLKIISSSASYSQQCSTSADEHSKIFWFKFDEYREILRQTPSLLVNGYVSDAQIFQVDDQLYLIMAIFYNKETKTHATDSLLYQFDLTNGKPFLVQRIPTDGAKSINVFQIPKVGIHVLIGCVKGRAESLLLRFNPITRQFQMIRTFATGGSKYIASVSSNEKTFVILSNPDVRALQIFNYEDHSDTFVDYQILFFQSRTTSLGVFYSGDFGQSDVFVVTTTKDGWLYIYEYMFYGMFQQKMSYWADDIQVLTPFRHMNENYLFAGFKFNSTVYKVIQQGY